jgi:hypothetical protein
MIVHIKTVCFVSLYRCSAEAWNQSPEAETSGGTGYEPYWTVESVQNSPLASCRGSPAPYLERPWLCLRRHS